jgi:hypothetical protein
MKESLETQRIKSSDGTVAYYVSINEVNKMHNWDGAALIPQGNKRKAEYYLFGIKYTKEQWLDFKKESNGIPFYKTSAGRAAGVRV